jgi:beta-galactosidase
MFDFAADARNEGGSVGINNKGLVTYDRKTRKEPFYIYQAYWSRKPMVHVCGERFPNRGPEEHEVIVYSNCDTVTLYVNGEAVETQTVVDHAAKFVNVPLRDGANTVTAASGEVKGNTITLNALPEPDASYVRPVGEDDIPAGNWFDGLGVGTDDDHMEFPEGFYSVKDTVADVYAIRNGRLIVELLANVGAFGPITAIRTMQPPLPLMDFILQVGALPAGGMSYINAELNKIPKA